MHRRSGRHATALTVAALAVMVTAGCSSSSSSGTPSGNGSTAPGTPGSSTPAPTHTKSPDAGGPAGPKTQVTTPTTVAPTKGAIGGSEVFPHITPSEGKHLTARLLKLPGVRSATYYTNFKQLQVYFDDNATQDQKAAAARAVTGG
jgi:hypothetical protein